MNDKRPALLLLLTVVLGCGRQEPRYDLVLLYDKIKPGMNEAQVVQTIGQASSWFKYDSYRELNYVSQDGKHVFVVRIQGNKVVDTRFQ